MGNNLFNKNGHNGIQLSSKFYQSRRYQKFNSIFDTHTDNTIIMMNIERATVYEAKDFYEFLSELIDSGKNRIIVDLENVYFVDSVFFGTLIKVLKQVTKMGGYVKLIVDYKNKPELLSISSFQKIFETYPNLFEAVSKTKAS